jgi:hypothetical protein
LDPHYEWSLYDLLESDEVSDRKSHKRKAYLEAVRMYRESMCRLLQKLAASP